jgi:hypothetical protein
MKNTLIVDRRTAAEAIQWVLERWARVLDAIERKGIGR